MQNHVVYHCSNPDCGFRFPYQPDRQPLSSCPRCGCDQFDQETFYEPVKVQKQVHQSFDQTIEVVLENIRSAFNVGSIFRTSDSAGIKMLHLCGMTSTPENPKVSKTALGAEFSLAWDYYPDSLEIIRDRHAQGYHILALEGGNEAINLQNLIPVLPSKPILLVLGSEVSGLDPRVLSYCHQIVSIPMSGFKDSLNVAVAYGIAAYFLRYFPRNNNNQ
ncbi:MAG: RNA methyltransferase [Anaerolineaceae bacterium]|nr:RNA methyltransferase [Anaerolineaceae bacterium]